MIDNNLEPRRLFLEQFYSGYIGSPQEMHRAQKKAVADASAGYAWPYPVFVPGDLPPETTSNDVAPAAGPR